MWSILFGWWMALFYIVASVVLFVSIVGIPYGKLCWRLASYVFWPFGKYVVEKATQYNRNPGRETSSLIVRPYAGPHSIRNIAGYVVWLLMLIVLVLPMQAISLVITWLTIVPIPMAKVNLEIIRLLFRKPLHIAIEPDYSTAQSHVIKICTHQAFNIYYFKFRIWGMNIIFVNLFPLVVFTVIESYAVPEHYALPPVAKFFVDLVCTVPITFYIGMAISSIAAQTNYMVGAVLHATFGSITELILYGSALRHGGFDILVTFAVTGGLLSDMLLVPGLSMIVGGFRYKEQKFNTLASGVSSILLFISVIGIFTPTIFYHTYGSFHQQCKECHFPPVLNHTNLNDTAENITMPLMQIAQSIGTLFNTNTSTNETTNDTSVSVAEVFCSGCVYYQDDLDNDPMFTGAARNIMCVTTNH
jgi:Ca2+:H+ antiporter